MREMSKGKENFALSDGNVFKYFLYICKPSVVDLIYFKL